MENFARATKETLTAEMTHWRVMLTVRHIAQAYEFTWEPRLKELIHEITARHIYDPEGEVLLSKERPYRSSTYKTETDGDVLVYLYRLFGDRLFYDMAKAISRHTWKKSAILPPERPGQNRATGAMGYFLWEETKSPEIAAAFDYSRRRLIAERFSNIETGEIILPCVSQIPRYFKGIPIAMDILAHLEEQKTDTIPWIVFNVATPPIRVFFTKPGETTLRRHADPLGDEEVSIELTLRREGSASVEHSRGREEDGIVKPSSAGDSVILKPHTVLSGRIWIGHDLHSVTEKSSGITKVMIPKDAPGGIYEIEITKSGKYSVFMDKKAPLALYAPEGWKPPAMSPPVATYFKVPEGREDAKIFFEKSAYLFTPEGEVFNNEAGPLSGWVKLPGNLPGLWKFESTDPGMVKTENLPAFFSMGSPDFYMEHE